MVDLANRGPVGPKKPKPTKKRRKAIPRKSKKRIAHEASEEYAWELAHMAKVKRLPCLVCGMSPVEVHHEGKPRSGFNVLPLCPRHHRREYGPGAYHYSPKAFYRLHGSSEDLLKRVNEMLKRHP